MDSSLGKGTKYERIFSMTMEMDIVVELNPQTWTLTLGFHNQLINVENPFVAIILYILIAGSIDPPMLWYQLLPT